MQKASISMKIDIEMRDELDKMAEKQFRSRNKLIEMILKEYVSRQTETPQYGPATAHHMVEHEDI